MNKPEDRAVGQVGPGRQLIRVVAFWLGYLVVLWVMSIPKAMVPPEWQGLVWGVASSLGLLALTVSVLRWEGRKIAEAGLGLDRKSGWRFLAGLGLGLLFFGLQMLAVRMLAGPFQLVVKPQGTTSMAGLAIAGTMALAAMEELGFRGYPLRTLLPRIGLWPAQLLVAVAFGLCHKVFGWSWQAIALGVIPSALIFGIAALISRGLAMPIGVHAGVNLAQSCLVGGSSWGWLDLTMDELVRARVAQVAPISGAVVAVVLFLAMAAWHWRRGQER